MKKDFCIDCKRPLIRKLEKEHWSRSGASKTCVWCVRVVAPRASRKPMRSKKK